MSDIVDVPKELDTLEKIEEEVPVETEGDAKPKEEEEKEEPSINDSSILPLKEEESVKRQKKISQQCSERLTRSGGNSSGPIPSPYLKQSDELPQTPKQFPQMDESMMDLAQQQRGTASFAFLTQESVKVAE